MFVTCSSLGHSSLVSTEHSLSKREWGGVAMTRSTLFSVTQSLQRASSPNLWGERPLEMDTVGKASRPCAAGHTAQCNKPSTSGLDTSSEYKARSICPAMFARQTRAFSLRWCKNSHLKIKQFNCKTSNWI